jgi:hypothetical protein
VPDSDTTTALFEALLNIETVPVTFPAAEGVNVTLNVTLWPTPTVTGSPGALRKNGGALGLAPVIVTEAFPLLVAVTVRVLLPPTTMLPKLSEELLNPRSPIGAAC